MSLIVAVAGLNGGARPGRCGGSMADENTYRLMATDSAGTAFEVGTAEDAIKAFGLVRVVEARLPVRSVEIRGPDGEAIDRFELMRRAQEEVNNIARARALAHRSKEGSN
jgi:hypothetical protein